MLVITDDKNSVKRAIPSPDLLTYAVVCEGGSKVYIADLVAATKIIKILDYGQEVINAIRWKPQTSQLCIAGGSDKNIIFELYDVNKGVTEDLAFMTEGVVLDVQLSADGGIVYFIEKGNEQLVTVYQILTGQKRYLVAYLSNNIIAIGRKGNFLTAFDGSLVFVWNLETETLCGRFQSQFESVALSNDGSDLAVLDPKNTSNILVYKYCKDLQHIYNA